MTQPTAASCAESLARPLRDAELRLRQAGVRAPEREARLLAGHVFGEGETRAPTAAQLEQYASLVQRRCQRIPLEHLTGKAPFRGLELLVGPGVFVPQPETSCVVQWAVDALHELIAAGHRHPRCVDLCTGSGTIALALASEVPAAEVHAVELDQGALAWAARNAEHHALTVHLHESDVAHALPELSGQFDLVTSNPPYVAASELPAVAPEVRDHDPTIALTAGTDGLDVIRSVERTASRLLRPAGLVVVEHSDRQGRSAPAVFAATGAWKDITEHPDHENLDRYVTATKL